MRNFYFFLFVVAFQSGAQAQYNDVVYINLYNEQNFSRSINTAVAVGAVGGQHEVTLSGSANYTVPLVVPPGTNSFSPSIGLSYNSTGADGHLGSGWNINGLSAISRVDKDFFHDGEMQPVDLTSNDRFALDGQRLVAITGTYGADNTVYYTKSESFSRIKSFGNMTGGGPAWFQVETKNGLTYEFGNSTDSKLLKEDNSLAVLWYVNKIYDKYNNYIEFKYKSDERDFRIDEILYTGNSTNGIAPYNKIKFIYSYRTDKKKIFLGGGVSLNTNFLLTRIQVKAENDVAFKEYEMLYGFDNIHSYLAEVLEWGDDGTRLNATLFKYGNAGTAFSANDEPFFINNSSIDCIEGDFNADGHSDIMAAAYDYDENDMKYHTSFTIHRNQPFGSGDAFTPSYTENLPVNYQIIEGYKIPNTFGFGSGDFNGDAKDDILLTYRVSSGQSKLLDQVKIYDPNDNANAFTVTTYTVAGPYNRIHPSGNYVHAADFDGDGRSDYMTILSNGTGYKVYISFPHANITKEVLNISNSNYPGTAWVIADYFTILDFDGDGKLEVMVVDEGLCEIFTFKYFTSNSVWAEKIYSSGYPTKWHKIFPGDFNGDRKTDILTRTSAGAWEVSLSTGKGFSSSSFTFITTFVLDQHHLKIDDFDGDGKSDIVHGYDVSNTARFQIYYNRGNTFYAPAYYTYNKILGFSGPNGSRIVSGDFNGDGQGDLFQNIISTKPNRFFYFRPSSESHLLDKATNGFHHLVNFDYTIMTDGGGFNYTRGATTAYPLNNIQMPVYVVSNLYVSNGIGGTTNSNYKYEEAKYHRGGRGWIGFKKITITNSTMNRKSISEFEVNTTYYTNMLKTSEERRSDNNAQISLATMTNSVVPLSNGRYWQRVDQTNTDDFVKGFTQTIASTFDSYGNVTQTINTRKKTGSTTNQEVTTTTNQYGTYGSWIASSPTQTTVSNVRNSLAAFDKTIKRTFNTQGSMTQEINFWNLAKAVTTNYSYNTFGNLTGTSVSATGLTTRNNTYGYDTKGRFITSIVNPLNQTETATYSAKWGKPLTKTTNNGLTTTYEYDGFGRLKKVTTPEGNIVQTSWGWDVQGAGGIGQTTIVYYTNTQMPGRPDKKEWFDVLGRSRKTETEGRNFQWVVEQTTYDARGNVATKTAPYFSGNPAGVVTTTTYDVLNRVNTVSNGIGTTTYAYELPATGYLTKITKPDGQIVTSTEDASGRVVESTDNGGTATYNYNVLSFEYNSQGNKTKVSLGTTELVTMAYDIYGRQSQLNDKNSGITLYSYNAFDELSSETDAKGYVHTLTYDVMGRITTRVGPEGTTTYEFETTNNGLNLVKKVTGFNGILQEYTYDTYSRLTQEKETIDGTAYITGYTYNTYGDVTGISYPSGFGISRQYDSNGFLNSIKNAAGTVTLYTTGGMNAYGQYTSYTLGNGVTSQITYNTYGYPTRFLAGTLQDLNLAFNIQNGNLDSRYDAIKGKTETFTYDNLERLISATVTGQAAVSVTFAANGNIQSKSNIGTYSYNVPKHHALYSVTNPVGWMPGAVQSVTYTAFDQPATIVEGIYNLALTYGSDYERRKTVLSQSGSVAETRYFLGSCEKQIIGGTTRFIHYINGAENLNAIVVREGTNDYYYYTYTDHLGSILTVTNSSGTIVGEQNFDPWGRSRNPTNWTYTGLPTLPAWLYRGYTGHESLPQFTLINMNGRLYDPFTGRMLSADNFVQSPFNSQNYNRYSYVLNNPLKYTDPNGQVWFMPIIIGAIIGAATSAAVYSATASVTGDWTWKGFGRALAFGAVGGAISGGIGAAFAGSAFAQSLAFGVLKSTASTIGTNLVFGQDITVGTIVGSIVGGLIIGGVLPSYKGVQGGSFINGVGEVITNAGFGALAGAFSGGIAAAIDGRDIDQGIGMGIRYGAIGGAVQAGLNIMVMGTTILPPRQYAKFDNLDIVYRRGTFLFPKGAGLTLGRNLIVRHTGNKDMDNYTFAHETGHLAQEVKYGWGRMYAKTFGDYMKYGMEKAYSTPGTLEWNATSYASKIIGYWYDIYGTRYNGQLR